MTDGFHRFYDFKPSYNGRQQFCKQNTLKDKVILKVSRISTEIYNKKCLGNSSLMENSWQVDRTVSLCFLSTSSTCKSCSSNLNASNVAVSHYQFVN